MFPVLDAESSMNIGGLEHGDIDPNLCTEASLLFTTTKNYRSRFGNMSYP